MLKQKAIIASVCAVGVGGFSGILTADELLSKIDVKTYGQVNLGYMYGDTGDGSESYIVDNDNSASRLGAIISGYVPDLGFTVGAHVELEYQQNASNLVNADDRSISGEFSERQLHVFLQGDFGKVSLGQGDGAANGNTEIDLSGTKVVSFGNPALVGGALSFVDRRSEDAVRLGSAMSNQDFESRYDRLRYDSPSLGPVNLALSQGVKGNDDVTETGLRVSVPFAGKLTGGLGYSQRDTDGSAGKISTMGGSLSWLHDSGINLTGAYSRMSDDDAANPDSDFYLAKLGYKWGKHAVDLHYAEAQDRAASGDSAETVGVGYVYAPVKWLNLYAGYNNHSLDRQGGNYDDVNTFLLGSLVKF